MTYFISEKHPMRMTSLSRTLAAVGLGLLVVVTLINFLQEPSTGARILSAPAADSTVRNDAPPPERRGADQSSAKTAEVAALPQAERPADQPEEPLVSPASPAMRAAPAALWSSSGAADADAARSAKAAKAKINAERQQRKRAAQARERRRQIAVQRHRERMVEYAPVRSVEPFGWGTRW